MSITTECMVLTLNIGKWTAQRLDKAASHKVTAEARAEAGAARVNKHLLPDAALAEISQAASAVRQHFYARTLPWTDAGARLTQRSGLLKFLEEHESLVAVHDKAADRFAFEIYPAERERAQFRMGTLFNAGDYPSPAEVRRRFYVSLEMEPVNALGDFRVKVSENLDPRVVERLEKTVEARLQRAMAPTWKRLADALSNYVERTTSNSGIRVELVENLRELVQVIPVLNVVDDPNLERLRQMIEAKLIGHDAAELRTNDATRQKAAEEARAIMEHMAGIMAAFGNPS
jgi:hypothetical protein